MHLTGKIFAFLTMCLAIGAVIMTAKVLDKQNEWNERVEKARAAYQKVIAELPDAKAQLSQLQDELTIQRLDWGKHWDNVDVTITDKNRGILRIDIGKNQGLVRETEAGDVFPTLYAFQPEGAGMVYVGAFPVTQAGNAEAALKLNRPPHPGEAETWKPGKWRFRNGFPASQEGKVGDLLITLTTMEQQVKNRTLNLTIQQKSVANAKKLLEQRLKELNGDAELPENIEIVYREGLIETLRKAQDQRDESLAQVQRLRQQLHDLYGKFETLLAKNEQLETKLHPATKTGQNAGGLKNNVKN